MKSSRLAFEALEARSMLTGSSFPDVDYFGDERDWALNAVQAPEVWSAGHTGKETIVAVIDSGIDLDHPEWANQLWTNQDEIPGNGIDDDQNGYIDDRWGWDFVDDDATPEDLAGHGTRIAGIIAAANDSVGSTGIAFGAEVMPLRVLNQQGAGSQFDIASAIWYAVDNGAHVINLSVGATIGSQRMQRAVEHALRHNVLIVAAAGNLDAATPDYPAVYSRDFANVISVGAFNQAYERAEFSNRVGSSAAVQVDAPGVSVYTTGVGDSYHFGRGTSFATPIVAGVAALMLSASPTLEVEELRRALTESATISIAGTDGLGGIDAALATASVVTVAEPLPPRNPLSGDVDEDGRVGMADFLLLSANYNQSATSRLQGDLNEDGRVNFVDFLELARNFGKTRS